MEAKLAFYPHFVVMLGKLGSCLSASFEDYTFISLLGSTFVSISCAHVGVSRNVKTHSKHLEFCPTWNFHGQAQPAGSRSEPLLRLQAHHLHLPALWRTCDRILHRLGVRRCELTHLIACHLCTSSARLFHLCAILARYRIHSVNFLSNAMGRGL